MKVPFLFALASVAAGAHAQLVVALNAPSATGKLSGAFYVDVLNSSAQQLWTGAQSQSRVTGIVAMNGTLYGASGLRGFSWEYGAVGTNPAEVDRFYRLGADNVVYGTSFANLTTHGSDLYGYTNFNTVGGTQVEDGIYRIDPTNRATNSVDTQLVWRHDDRAYNFEGLAYNEADGLFYSTNNPASNAPSGAAPEGLYTIDAFGTGAVTKIADFSSLVPEASGLTFGGGKLWMSGKMGDETDLRLISYDLTTKTYGDAFSIDGFATGNRQTALVWAPGANQPVPEPASLAALGLGAVALMRRRRK